MKTLNSARRGVRRAALAALALFCGCASAGTSSQGASETLAQVARRDREAKVTQHVDASVDSTWKVLGPAFQDLGYKAGPSANPSEHLYATPWLRLPARLYEGEYNSAYFDCGKTPLGLSAADSYEISFAVLAWVDADQPKGSVVRILVTGNARDRSNPSAMVACSGTGRLEAGLMQAIQRRLMRRGL